MKKLLLLFIFISLISLTGKAQLTVTEETNDTTFIYSLAGGGVTVSNLVRNCADSASGFYNSSAANVGIDSGIALTSGRLLNALGPNNNGSATGYNGTGGDADLDAAIPGYYTYDACIIEFDMTVAADTARISYVFGSEEYLEFVGSSFNDVFAFWVSGPGITDAVNIATIPGTDIPVAINNVNDLSYSDYFINNGDGYTDPYMSDAYYIQYDGMTVVLEAKIATIPGETYHMKIAVADAGDYILDSGVFLETGSLGSLRMGTAYYGDGTSIMAAEKCSNGYIEFINYLPSDMDLVFDYHISGTAENGVDYEVIAEQITVPAGLSTATLPIIPIEDTEAEGSETIILELYNPQSGYIYSTVVVNLEDELLSDFTSEIVGSGLAFTSSSDDAVSWSWDFGDGTTSTEENPSHTYASSGTYTVCLTITNTNSCSVSTCKQVSAAVGIDEMLLSLEAINIYPNPASDNFTIDMPAEIAEATVIIKNILGEDLRAFEINTGKTEVNSSDLAKGMYYLEIQSKESIVTKTIEIQ
ncbi:MAG: choice-of-anchor L domain-containing protein [Chitinophagales bacterium]|nr:choice-of-anchor L domain-containing protein [Chitinophagales bacterium]